MPPKKSKGLELTVLR